MDPAIAPAHGHIYEEEHHEKTPVLKKVKDRVRKFKDTFSNKMTHGHGNVHDHPDSQVQEEEGCEEVDEESEVDPQVNGGPTYGTADAPHAAAPSVGGGKDEDLEREGGTSGIINGRPLEEDPAVPEPGSEKFTTGGDEARRSPVVGSFQAMKVSARPEGQQGGERSPSTGTQGQFSSPENTRPAGPVPEYDDEIEVDPQVHGSPLSGTAAAPHVVGGQDGLERERGTSGIINGRLEEDPALPEPGSEKFTAGGDEERMSPVVDSFRALKVSDRPEGQQGGEHSLPTGTHRQFSSPEKTRSGPEDDDAIEVDPQGHGGPPYGTAGSPHVVGGRDEGLEGGRGTSGIIKGRLEEDPAAGPEPRSEKLTAGGDEERMSPVVGSFQEPEGQQGGEHSPPTGADDRLSSPEKTRSSPEDDEEIEVDPQVHGGPPYGTDAAPDVVGGHDEGLDRERGTSGIINGRLEEDPAVPEPRSEKLTAGGDEARMSPVVGSFEALKVSDRPDGQQGEQRSPLTGTHDQSSSPEKTGPDPQETLGESAEPAAKQLSYTEKLSPTVSAVKDTAVSTEGGDEARMSPVQAPKVSDRAEGQQGGECSSPPTGTYGQFSSPENTRPGSEEKPGESAEPAAKQPSYTEKLSSTVFGLKDTAVSAASTVYGKVAGAGPAGVGKVQQSGAAGASGGDGKAGQVDKGVSVREYLAEKLRPGEEDRALCEVISESVHKTKDEEAAAERAPATGSGEGSDGKGMVEKIRGVVTSLIGGGAGSGASPVTSAQAKGGEVVEGAHQEPERREQEKHTE